jgi:hypothetical protein
MLTPVTTRRRARDDGYRWKVRYGSRRVRSHSTFAPYRLSSFFPHSHWEWPARLNLIWACGPKQCGPNILFNFVPGFRPSSWWFDALAGSLDASAKATESEGGRGL